MSRTFYLNDSHTRYVIYDNNGKKEKIDFNTKSGNKVKRAVQCYEKLDDICTLTIKHKGKLIKVFINTLLDD